MFLEATKEVLCAYFGSKIFYGFRNNYLIIEFAYSTLNNMKDAVVFAKNKMFNIQLLFSQ